jgi:hypothetical protein
MVHIFAAGICRHIFSSRKHQLGVFAVIMMCEVSLSCHMIRIRGLWTWLLDFIAVTNNLKPYILFTLLKFVLIGLILDD